MIKPSIAGPVHIRVPNLVITAPADVPQPYELGPHHTQTHADNRVEVVLWLFICLCVRFMHLCPIEWNRLLIQLDALQ